MSKTRWIILLLTLVVWFSFAPLSKSSSSSQSKLAAAGSQQERLDFCCLAGLACCIIAPSGS